MNISVNKPRVVVPPTVSVPEPAKAAEALEKFTAEVGGVVPGMSFDFSASPLGANDAVRLFLGELTRGDPADLVKWTQFLGAIGVNVGNTGAPLSHFHGATHRLAKISFPTEYPAALKPAYEKVQELSALTKQIAIALQSDQRPESLRANKIEAVKIAHTLAEMWRQAPVHVGGDALQGVALAALKNVAELQGRIQFAMQDYVEDTKRDMVAKLPADKQKGLQIEGPQPLLDPADASLVYRNSLRIGRVELDPVVRQAEIDAKAAKSLKKGIKPDDIKEMSPAFMNTAPDGERFEYVLIRNGAKDQLNVTMTEAGHTFIAGVNPRQPPAAEALKLEDKNARVAGGGRILRAADGDEIIFLDPSSGHYRAPVQQIDRAVPFVAAAGVPADRIIVTPGDPLATGEILAIDVWMYKSANENTLPKDVGDGFADAAEKLYQDVKAQAKVDVAALLPAVQLKV